MSEMFESSLWKRDFSKLFTVVLVFYKRKPVVKVVEGLEVTGASLQLICLIPKRSFPSGPWNDLTSHKCR